MKIKDLNRELQAIRDRELQGRRHPSSDTESTPAPTRETPIEALQLSEDIGSIQRAIQELKRINWHNITADRTFGEEMWSSTMLLLSTWERYARLKMRQDYLIL